MISPKFVEEIHLSTKNNYGSKSHCSKQRMMSRVNQRTKSFVSFSRTCPSFILEANMTNGTTQEESIMTSPDDIILEEPTVNGVVSEEDGAISTPVHENEESAPNPGEETTK